MYTCYSLSGSSKPQTGHLVLLLKKFHPSFATFTGQTSLMSMKISKEQVMNINENKEKTKVFNNLIKWLQIT